MAFSFDGPNKIITLSVGTTALDVKDLYSRWKDWIQTEEGSKWDVVMYPVGGDPINEDEGIYVSSYIFLSNGWKIRPQEANHTLVVSNGILLTDTGVDPFIPTTGYYNVQVKYSQPIRTETVQIGGGSGGLTQTQDTKLTTIYTISSNLSGTNENVLEVSSQVAGVDYSITEVSLQVASLSGNVSEVSSQVASLSGDISKTVTVGRLLAFG